MIDKLTQWANHYTSSGGNWLFFFFALITISIILFLLRRIFWRKITAYVKSTAVIWDDLLVERMNFPVRILLIITAIFLASPFAPDEVRADRATMPGMKIAIVFTIIWIVDRLISIFFHSSFFAASFTGSTRVLFITLTRVFFFAIGGLVFLDTLGISITPILASLGVGSVAVALALQDTLSNFFSGIYLLVDKPIRLGDFVQIDDSIEGTIIQIGWRSTHVRLLSNNTVILPNTKIASARITNFDMPEKEMSILINASVAYGSNLSKVEQVTIEVAQEVLKNTQGGVKNFQPFIRYNVLADSSINFTVILRGSQFVDQFLIKHEFIKALHDRFIREGIEIPFPQRVVHLHEQKNKTVFTNETSQTSSSQS